MISLIVPLYNEEDTVRKLVSRIKKSSKEWPVPYELILVNDGSTDGTADIVTTLIPKHPQIRLINLSRNFGHQAAISAGLADVRGDVAIILDGDLQDPPEELHRFIAKWREGYDVVYAIRENRKEHLLKKLAYNSFYRILHIVSDIPIPLDSGDFCLMDRKVVDVLVTQMPEQLRFVRGLRAYAGFRQTGLSYDRPARFAGETKYSMRKLIQLALDGVFGFSMMPLRLASYTGLVIALPSFLVGLFFVVHRIFNFKIFGYAPSDTPGLATLAVGVFFLGGVMLIFLGIIGEYIGRIYMEVKRRPQFIIQEVISSQSSGKS